MDRKLNFRLLRRGITEAKVTSPIARRLAARPPPAARMRHGPLGRRESELKEIEEKMLLRDTEEIMIESARRRNRNGPDRVPAVIGTLEPVGIMGLALRAVPG